MKQNLAVCGATTFKAPKGTLGFQQDLAEAHQIENNLIPLLQDYWDCTVTTSQDKGAFSGWYLKVAFKDPEEPDLTIEVKQDRRVNDTGNVAVELGRVVNGQWRDTCLSATESDVYAYYFNDTYHLLDTSTLKWMVDNEKYSRIVQGGDANRARCALFPVDYFLKQVVIKLKHECKKKNYFRRPKY